MRTHTHTSGEQAHDWVIVDATIRFKRYKKITKMEDVGGRRVKVKGGIHEGQVEGRGRGREGIKRGTE